MSGLFLLLVAALNAASLAGMSRAIRHHGAGSEALEELLQNRGVMNPVTAPLVRRTDKPGKMYPAGLIFGLGVDTGTTIGLLALGGSVAMSAPWYVALCCRCCLRPA